MLAATATGLADVSAEMRAMYEGMRERGERGGWRVVGRAAGVSSAYAWQIAYGKRQVTPPVARAWLLSTGKLLEERPVPVCPDCGEPHTAPRCYGREVAAVVVLAPGERVTAEPEPAPIIRKGPKRARKPVYRPYIPDEREAAAHRRIEAELKRRGASWQELERSVDALYKEGGAAEKLG